MSDDAPDRGIGLRSTCFGAAMTMSSRLTYGVDVDWVKNVEAAGACNIESRGRTIHLVGPQRFTDPTGRDVPGPVRAILRLIDVDDFMVMHAT